MCTIIRFYLLILLFHPVFSTAQNLTYSPFIDIHRNSYFEVAGKAGAYYWVAQKTDRAKTKKRQPESDLQSLEVFDEHLKQVREVSPVSSPDIKSWLIPGLHSFDETGLSTKQQGIDLIINRYSPDGEPMISNQPIIHFSFSESGSRFLLARSEDLSKLLLLAFESQPDKAPILHALLFDQDWTLIYNISLENESISQPCIQEDFTSLPIESFDRLPLKLADNGDWFMASPSRTDNNYLLFHFDNERQQLLQHAIRLSSYFQMEDISLSINNQSRELGIGILSNFGNTTLKKVSVLQYSMPEKRIFFDSSYQFNTVAGNLVNKNLTKEDFIPLPQGFMLFKEYGRSKDDINLSYSSSEQFNADLLTAVYSLSVPVLEPLKTAGYTYKAGLAGVGSTINKSQLAMYNFPGSHTDSTWSGIIHSAQSSDLNGAALSYFVLPLKDKIYILYNDLIRDGAAFGTTTALNLQGQPLNDAVFFWKMSRTLYFKDCRQISSNELAVPYAAPRNGFAIIRF